MTIEGLLERMARSTDPEIRAFAEAERAKRQAAKSTKRASRKRRAEALALPGRSRAERSRERQAERLETRPLVEARARGRCEAVAALAPGAFSAEVLRDLPEARPEAWRDLYSIGPCYGRLIWDHFFGRGKVDPDVEFEWMICETHDRMKTDNDPSHLLWLRLFRLHCAQHRYTRSLTMLVGKIALEEAQNPTQGATDGV